MEIFESKRQDPTFGLTYYDTRSQVITSVNGHMISKNLEPVLEALFSIYGNFSAKSKMSQYGNTFIFVIICAAIYSICNTKDAEINECQLLTCWDCFKIAKHAGFEVQFAIDRLRRAMLSYFGLGSTGPALAKLDNDDAAIKLMKELEEKCMLLDNEMANLSEGMKALQEKRELRMTTLLSYSMGKISRDIIEIVGPNKVLTSWDDEHWDDPSETSEQECRGETSEPERLTLGEEGQKNGTLKLVRYSKTMPAENLTKLIKTFIERKDDEVFLVQKDGSNVFEQSVVKDPAHDCSSTDCTSPKSSEELQQKINNCGFHKKHTLSLFKKVKDKSTSNKSNKKVKDEAVCIACDLPISDDERVKSYHCAKCKIFLHNFCVNFPKEIAKHPLHLAHPLTLDMDTERLGKTTTCNACGEKFRGSCVYGCQGCNFYLEVQCLFLEPEPTIQSHSHGNLLLLEETRPTYSPHRCFACGKKIADPPFLRCPPCNISLHFQCPLSYTIQNTFHEQRTFHEHALALTPWYFGDADNPDCKICKKEMSAMHPTYYCQECGYVAHINCATSNATFNVEQRSRSVRK
ncbi:Diacylglycerol kinase [Actinidia chinensis var. chinensis]|uniref:Diacylglycerol kinase n=1 Tax=Actinidia chinensis var. chinensis TaxID=1590841 RepID=A0A2R6NUJ5_ACTCC|nr:Diacylglycerol kinase [Actinidia chinensis var. chinensis]